MLEFCGAEPRDVCLPDDDDDDWELSAVKRVSAIGNAVLAAGRAADARVEDLQRKDLQRKDLQRRICGARSLPLRNSDRFPQDASACARAPGAQRMRAFFHLQACVRGGTLVAATCAFLS